KRIQQPPTAGFDNNMAEGLATFILEQYPYLELAFPLAAGCQVKLEAGSSGLSLIGEFLGDVRTVEDDRRASSHGLSDDDLNLGGWRLLAQHPAEDLQLLTVALANPEVTLDTVAWGLSDIKDLQLA